MNNNNFTPRELDVLRLIAEGLSNKEIANTLFVTESNVKVYAVKIYNKLGIQDNGKSYNRVKAALYYLNNIKGIK